MNRTTLGIFIGLIWIIGAIIYLINSNFLMTALFLLVGLVFVASAKREANKK